MLGSTCRGRRGPLGRGQPRAGRLSSPEASVTRAARVLAAGPRAGCGTMTGRVGTLCWAGGERSEHQGPHFMVDPSWSGEVGRPQDRPSPGT